MVRAGVRERVATSLTGHKTRIDRYTNISEADLHGASKMIQSHLEEQPKMPVVVPLKAVS